MQHPVEINSDRDNPLEALRFRWPWRDYQERILKAYEEHAGDERIHVVAAPGSGKTVLGLEIIRRIGRRALILAPTRIVRDQWIARLADFGAAEPSWTSTELDAPGYVTSITYQALHTQHRADRDKPPDIRESEEIAALLREHGVGVLVLDEAHHLRKAWWRALTRIVEQLDDLMVVSLTATSPYDSIGSEWAAL